MENNPPQIVIIDDFYPDLSWLFPYLESLTPKKDHQVNYAGVTYPAPVDQNIFALEKIERLFHLTESLSSGEIRVTLKKDGSGYQSLIHADESYNVLIYLSGREETQTGTSFYRHKQLGISSTPTDPLMQKKISVLFDHDTKTLDRWELIQQVPFKVNRAIFFNGRTFHSVPQDFYGDDLRSGRITQNFFFKDPIK